MSSPDPSWSSFAFCDGCWSVRLVGYFNISHGPVILRRSLASAWSAWSCFLGNRCFVLVSLGEGECRTYNEQKQSQPKINWKCEWRKENWKENWFLIRHFFCTNSLMLVSLESLETVINTDRSVWLVGTWLAGADLNRRNRGRRRELSDSERGGEKSRGGNGRWARGWGVWKRGRKGWSLWVTQCIKVGTTQQRDRGDVATNQSRPWCQPRRLSTWG